MITSGLLTFLVKLEKHNNREWFENHKDEFCAHQSIFKSFNEHLLDEMKKHDEIEGLKIFRIYRDVRFSKNKTPYKTHLAASFKRIKPKLRGGYYLQIKPGESFIATGFWDPVKEDLLRIRKELEIDAKELNAIIHHSAFMNTWGALQGDEVKTAPKGFLKTHPNINLIRKKQFIFSQKFTDNQVCSPDFLEEVNQSFKSIRPFFDYMTDVLTTDLNGVSLLE